MNQLSQSVSGHKHHVFFFFTSIILHNGHHHFFFTPEKWSLSTSHIIKAAVGDSPPPHKRRFWSVILHPTKQNIKKKKKVPVKNGTGLDLMSVINLQHWPGRYSCIHTATCRTGRVTTCDPVGKLKWHGDRGTGSGYSKYCTSGDCWLLTVPGWIHYTSSGDEGECSSTTWLKQWFTSVMVTLKWYRRFPSLMTPRV